MSEFFIPQQIKKDLWYKEPWMFLVIGGPLLVVIAGFITLYLAIHNSDKVVAQDYYKQGLNINKTIEQDEKASALHMQGTAKFSPMGNKLSFTLSGNEHLPDTLQMTVSTNYHAREFETQQKISLTRVGTSQYEGALNSAIPASIDVWHVKVETGEWRLTGDWVDPYRQPLQLKPEN